MRLALISLAETLPGTDRPAACLPIADGLLGFAQIDLARRLGAEQIAFLVQSVPADLPRLERYARKLGMEIAIVRSIADVSVKLASDDSLILIGDGLFVDESALPDMGEAKGGFVATLVPGEGEAAVAERFERIDMNHLWAGLAVIKGSDLFEVRTLPAEWDPVSAALRVAVQRNYRRVTLPMRLVERRRLSLPANPEQAADLAPILMRRSDRRGSELGRAFWSSGIGQGIARRIWGWPWAMQALRAAIFLLPMLAMLPAFRGYGVAAICILALGRLADTSAHLLFGHFAGRAFRGWERTVHMVLSALAFILIMTRGVYAPNLGQGLYLALVAIGLSFLLRVGRSEDEPASAAFVASHGPFLLIAIPAVWFAHLTGWTMVWSLMALAYLAWRTMRPKTV